MTLTAAFPVPTQGIKMEGDPFTFKNTNAQDMWQTTYNRHRARSQGEQGNPEVNYHADRRSEMDFAAAIAARVESTGRQFTRVEEAVRDAYVAQVFSDTTKTPVAPAKVADTLGVWIHADAAERALNPTAVHDREVAALLRAEGRAPA